MALKVKIFKGYDSTVEKEINNFLSTKNLNENKISLTQSYYEEKKWVAITIQNVPCDNNAIRRKINSRF